MKYLSDCCKAEAIIRNNDVSLCSECHEECETLERWDIGQTPTQKNFSFIHHSLFDADLVETSPFGKILRAEILIGSLVNQY